MGQIADDAVAGLSCSGCGIYFLKPHGFPVMCRDCKDDGGGLPLATHPEMSDCDDETLDQHGWKARGGEENGK